MPRGLGEGILYIPCRKAPGVHLHGQLLQNLGVPLEEGGQLRVEGRVRIPHLRMVNLNLSFCGFDTQRLIAVPVPLLLGVAAPLIMVSTEKLGHFLFHKLLEHQGRALLHDVADDRSSAMHALQQLSQLLAYFSACWYSLHEWPPLCLILFRRRIV